MNSSAPRRAVTIGVPLLLGAIEVGHPVVAPGASIVQHVEPVAVWWTTLHVLAIPLFALLGVAVIVLVRDLRGRDAAVARIAAAIFAVVYPAFDAAVGVSSGVLVQNTAASARGALEPGFQALFWGPVTGSLAIVGGLAWAVATIAAARCLARNGAPAAVWLLLGASGISLAIAHIPPFGPLAGFAFAAAAILIERRKAGDRGGPSTSSG